MGRGGERGVPDAIAKSVLINAIKNWPAVIVNSRGMQWSSTKTDLLCFAQKDG